ncbi:MAG: hypothetical protein ABF537_14015, partial [Acetobacter sp.]
MEQQMFEGEQASAPDQPGQTSANKRLSPTPLAHTAGTASAEQIALLALNVQKLGRILRRFYQLAIAVVAALCVGLFIYAGG